jgi:hypothetical protein
LFDIDGGVGDFHAQRGYQVVCVNAS